jgi:hypothetical protein
MSLEEVRVWTPRLDFSPRLRNSITPKWLQWQGASLGGTPLRVLLRRALEN